MTSFGWENRAEFDQHVTRRLATKETMYDTHLITSEYELLKGQTQTTDCGLTIEKADTLPIWDDFATGSKLTLPTETAIFCQKCLLKQLERHAGPRKVYAVKPKRRQIQEDEE